MRTRYFDSLISSEIDEYLRRSDIIILPVGVVETAGEFPVGCEHVAPLAIAVKMAEECDGLVLPNLAYFYAGATNIASGTINPSPSMGAAYLKSICLSLFRKGFRRQILLTGHGPASVTVDIVVREFTDETHCPMVHIGLGRPFEAVKADYDEVIWGAYYMLGRIDEIPEKLKSYKRATAPKSRSVIGSCNISTLGFFFNDESQHGWRPEKPMTRTEGLKMAKRGVKQIKKVVEAINPKKLVSGMRDYDHYIKQKILPKYGDRLGGAAED